MKLPFRIPPNHYLSMFLGFAWSKGYGTYARAVLAYRERVEARDRASELCWRIDWLPRSLRRRSRLVRLWRACVHRMVGAELRLDAARDAAGGGR